MSVQLSAGEHVLFEGHPSWRATLAFYIKGLLGVIVVGALIAGISHIAEDSVNWGLVVLAAVVLMAAVVIGGYVFRMATTYTITNRRLHIKRGIVSRRTQEARLERVQNVNTNQSVIERLLRVGTVDFDTAGTDDHGFRFEGVDDPLAVTEAVDRAQREYASEHSGSGRLGADPTRGSGL
jgi:uncharacterized membrane protein YdbT with pleckstrin-like domain